MNWNLVFPKALSADEVKALYEESKSNRLFVKRWELVADPHQYQRDDKRAKEKKT